MQVGDMVRFEHDQTNVTKGKIREINEDSVLVEYVTLGYTMGSIIKKPTVVKLDPGDVEVIEE